MTYDRIPTLDDSLVADALLDVALEKIRAGDELPPGFIGNVLLNCQHTIEQLRTRERKAIAAVGLADSENPTVQALTERVEQLEGAMRYFLEGMGVEWLDPSRPRQPKTIGVSTHRLHALAAALHPDASGLEDPVSDASKGAV